MSHSPSDLSRHFTHTAILATAGITVKGITPEVTQCPFCQQDSLTIMLDPHDATLKWMHCSTCQWSGNTIDFYHRVNRLPSIPEAINKAVRDGWCLAPELINAESVRLYTSNYSDRRDALRSIWDKLASALSVNIHPEVLIHLQRAGLWHGTHPRYQDRMKRFLGGTTKHQLKKILAEYYVRPDQALKGNLPENGFQTMLAVPMQDAPGRICGFAFYDRHWDSFLKMIAGGVGKDYEGGLAGLDGLTSQEKTVLVTDDPQVWIALHHRQAKAFDEPAKVLLYNEHTERAWHAVAAERAIFWARELTLELFQHARRVHNGCIATQPYYFTSTGQVSKLGGSSLVGLTGELNRLARPWTEVFTEWVTDLDRPESDAVKAFEQLDLTPRERELILSVATQQQRHRLEGFLGATSRPRSVSVNGTCIVEQGDGWYARRPRGEERVLDATIHIDEELCDSEAGTSYMRGHIKFRGMVAEFTDLKREIERNPNAWIDRVTCKLKLGTVQVNKTFTRQLLDIARAFSNPQIKTISTSFGIQTDGSIVFPKFTLRDGQVLPQENFTPGSFLPLSSVVIPTRRTADQRDTVSMTRSAYLATFCTVVANWLETSHGLPYHPTAVVGGNGSIAREAVYHLATALGMPTLKLATGRYYSMVDLRRSLERMNCPCVVDRGNTIGGYKADSIDKIFLFVSPEELAGLRVSNSKWFVLEGPQMRRDNNPLPPVDDLIWYLADLQGRQYQLPAGPHILHSVIEDFCGWYERYLDRDQTETRQQAFQMASMAIRPGLEMLRLAATFVKAGLVGHNYAPIDSYPDVRNTVDGRIHHRAPGVVLDTQKGEVFVFQQVLMSAIGRKRLPMPDFKAATQDLVSNGLLLEDGLPREGWRVQMATWESVF